MLEDEACETYFRLALEPGKDIFLQIVSVGPIFKIKSSSLLHNEGK